MGNLNAYRDWGHAKDFVKMQWLMLQQEEANDFVIATGQQITVREFIVLAAKELGVEIEFQGKGLDEIGVVIAVDKSISPEISIGDVIIRINPKYFRPTEVETLLGDSSKAKNLLGWEPEITIGELCAEMVAYDLEKAKQNALLIEHGYSIFNSKED